MLEYIDFQWFGNAGWFGNADRTDLERRLIQRAIDRTAPAGGILHAQLDGLRRTDPPPDDPRWLDLCVKASEFALAMRRVQNGRAAVEHLKLQFPETYPGDRFLEALDAVARGLEKKLLAPWPSGDRETIELLEQLDRIKYEALVRHNPLLRHGKILFVKRFTYQTGWYYSEFMQAGRGGGNLCVLDLSTGEVSELCPQLDGGIFDRFDLSFDGRRVAFGYRPGPGKAFRLWEVGVDGTGLRPLTSDPPGEAGRLASYGLDPTRNELGPWRGHTDDFHPCYLPDGGVCFTSSRCERGVLCDAADNLSVNVLYRIDADGGNLHPLSQGALSESTPSVTDDGRILYTRWEYVEKGVIAVQSLWAMRPDGSGSTEVFGNHHEFPPVLIHGRSVPGRSDLFVATCTMHHPFAVGPILLIDTSRDIRTLAPLRSLTPDTHVSVEGVGGFPRGEAYVHWKNGRWVRDNAGPLFCEPWPLSDRFFLVTCNPNRRHNHPTAYGLWLVDTFGNRVEVYRDPTISCWQPVPLRPRARPPILPTVETISDDRADRVASDATLLLTDVYRGLDGVGRGQVKYLRIFEQVPRPWTAKRFWPGDIAFGQNAPISLDAHIFVKILHGVVPVESDGSAHFVVPADRNLFFQALDEDYMEIQRMRTFVNLRPGEVRGCIGCHQPQNEAPPARLPIALLRPADRPAPQPGDPIVPRPLYYPTDVQPILDRHCVRCHNGKRSDGELDLSGDLTTYFNRSYENLMNKNLVRYIQEFVGPQPRAQKTNVVPLPARQLGSHASKLVVALRQGHYEVELSRAEFVRLTTWVDANAPYYGSYFGRRNQLYEDHPDFRPVPTVESAAGVPNTPAGK